MQPDAVGVHQGNPGPAVQAAAAGRAVGRGLAGATSALTWLGYLAILSFGLQWLLG